MSENKAKASAVIVATIEIPLTDTWGTECTIGQVDEQARSSVKNMIARLQQRDACPPSHLPRGTTISNVKVLRIITGGVQ